MNIQDLIEEIGENQEVFLLDLSWHLYRSFYSFGNMTAKTSTGLTKPTGHIYGIIRTIEQIRKYNPDCYIILCVDGVPEDRLDEDCDYKADRPKLEYNFFQDVDIILDLAYLYPRVYSAYNPTLEADDLLYAIPKKLPKSTKSYVFCGDDDLLQVISDNIFVVRTFENNQPVEIDARYVKTNETMVRKFRGCSIPKLPFYRAIIGDKSDNLPGIPRFPRKLATLIATSIESIEDLKHITSFLGHNQVPPSQEKYLYMIEDQIDMIMKNYSMMKLTEDVDCEITRDEKDCSGIIEELNMRSLSKFVRRNQYV